MGVSISYMGTKKELAPFVADVIAQAKSGVLLDAFAGMCSVAEEVGASRQIWTNDIQIFAAQIGAALFTARDEPMSSVQAADLHFDAFQKHKDSLESSCRRFLSRDGRHLNASNFKEFTKKHPALKGRLQRVSRATERHSYRLFATTYSGSYFGLHQAIEADALIRAINHVHQRGKTSIDHKRWLMIALGRALLKISNSTGHFAQFLKPNESTFKRYAALRRRSLWSEWLSSIGELQPIGTMDWRRQNQSFNEDSLILLPRLIRQKQCPSVVYADPPYTDDQYSRYYHIWETLVLYDYPKTSGSGLYRPNRFVTPFSSKTKAPAAFDLLVKSAAEARSDLVLSYPTNGLIHDAGVDPNQLLKKYYRRVRCCYRLAHSHSTFGASKGAAREKVTELIYLAQL